MPSPAHRDAVDRIAAQWNAVRPDIDITPMTVIGRLSRAALLIDRRLATNFAAHGIESWMYDVLATLYRSGPPYELTAGDLVRHTMVTTGAITNRVDRLEARGFVERLGADDRRKVMVRLTDAGRVVVERVVGPHLDTEREILAALTPRQQTQLVNLLRTTLLGLGDSADER